MEHLKAVRMEALIDILQSFALEMGARVSTTRIAKALLHQDIRSLDDFVGAVEDLAEEMGG